MGIRPKFTYANVMVTLLAFVVLCGGGAYAVDRLAKNSVGTKQLKKNAVTTKKIKNGAVTAAKVRKGTLTGAQINESTLGAVPSADNAAKLGGVGPDGYVTGGVSFLTARVGLTDGQTDQPLLSIPGVGSFTVSCTNGADTISTQFTNQSGGRVVRTHGERIDETTQVTGGSLNNGQSTTRTTTVAVPNGGHVHNYEIAPADGPGLIAHVRIAAVSSATGEARCVVSATAIAA